MTRFAFALPLLLAAAVPAFAGGTMVNNMSGMPIDELFAAAPGSTEWGANLMDGIAEGSLDSGKSHEVAALADGTYDLRVSAPDEGVLCIMSNVEVKNATIELTEEMGKACK